MQPIDYKEFKKVNKITNLNISDYLGVSEAYVSMVTSGKTQFSAERLQKLLEHPTWNITPLLKGVRYEADMSTAPPLPDGTTYQPAEQTEERTSTLTTEQRLLAEVEALTTLNTTHAQSIAELIAQQGRLIALLEKKGE